MVIAHLRVLKTWIEFDYIWNERCYSSSDVEAEVEEPEQQLSGKVSFATNKWQQFIQNLSSMELQPDNNKKYIIQEIISWNCSVKTWTQKLLTPHLRNHFWANVRQMKNICSLQNEKDRI